jgi:outer membrane protein assembly factor BamB
LTLAQSSVERAVTDAAVLLLVGGAVLALIWGLLQRRLGLLRWPLLVGAVLALGVGSALGAWAWHEKRPRDVRGSSTQEFVQTLRPPPPVKKNRRNDLGESWPTYGYDVYRTHLAPTTWNLRPPFKGLWQLKARADIEFPPSVAYGKVYVAQQKGRFFAINARTGKIVWTRNFPNCAAASPTISDKIVYQAFMHQLPCRKHAGGARGFVIAWDARNGRALWRFTAGSVESSPVLVGKMLYFGSWDGGLYALRLRGRKRPLHQWTFKADDQIVAAPAYANGTIYIATSSGSVYGVYARTGKLRWRSSSFSRFGRREYFYATPTVAYGRVFVGNADGTVYAFGAATGRLLWARQVGTYVYSAPAVWRKAVYVGTWDGHFVALDAATGDTRWRYEAPASITGAPTVVDGIVYFSTCGRCGVGGQRRVKTGPRVTIGLDARNGRKVWSYPDGKYSPVVADPRRLYLVGRNKIYALIPLSRWRSYQKAKAAERARKQRARKRARRQPGAKPRTTSGTPG